MDAEVLRKFPPIECWCVRRVTNSRSRLTASSAGHVISVLESRPIAERTPGVRVVSVPLWDFLGVSPLVNRGCRRSNAAGFVSARLHGGVTARHVDARSLRYRSLRGDPPSPHGFGLTMELQVRSTKVGCYRCRSSRCQVNDNGSSGTGGGTLLTLSLLTLDAGRSPHTGPKMIVWVLK